MTATKQAIARVPVAPTKTALKRQAANEPAQVNVASIPAELKAIPRWVVWKYVDGRKLPFDANNYTPASSTDPSTWASFNEAWLTHTDGGFAGIGIVLDGTDRLAGIDLDGCVVDGVPTSEALALLASMEARYIEVSPSGKGLRAFGYADALTAGANGQIGGLKAELYSKGRYLTVTGNSLQTGPLSELVGFAEAAQAARDGKKAAREATKPPAPTYAPPSPAKAAYGADKRVQAYVDAAIDGATKAVASAGEGTRNDTLNSAALGLFRLREADPSTVWQALTNAALAAGLDPREVAATLASARNAADNMQPRPMPPPEQRSDWHGFTSEPQQWRGEGDDDDDGAIEPVLKPVDVLGVWDEPSEPTKFLFDGRIPRGTTSLFGAHGGVGKSTIALMLCVAAATGQPLFGAPTAPTAPTYAPTAPTCAIFVSLEDGAHVVRHRLGAICRWMNVNPRDLAGKLHIVDGTENPELFMADSRNGSGAPTRAYSELRTLVQQTGAGLVVIDNASDAFGGDEIVRRQVRAFIRSLNDIAKESDAAVVLLAHVNKTSARNGSGFGGDSEGYSGSTAWHNSTRSRLFLSRNKDDTLSLEHQKNNLGRRQEPLTLLWPDNGFPQVAGHVGQVDYSALDEAAESRQQDKNAEAVLKMLAEFESRKQYASPAATARNNVFALLRGEPMFKRLHIGKDHLSAIVNQCQRAGWIDMLEYRTQDRKERQRWTVTERGREWARIPSAPTAPTAPTCHVSAEGAEGADWVRPPRPHP
jgi:RecA-family ATPase